MKIENSPPIGVRTGCSFPTRREVLAAATAALASAAAGSPAQAQVETEGYFLVFENPGNDDHLDRLFFIPTAWLALFEVTEIYKARYPSPTPNTGWRRALHRLRTTNAPDRKFKFHALYADAMDAGMFEPFPDDTVLPAMPPGSNETYIAAMVAPNDLPT